MADLSTDVVAGPAATEEQPPLLVGDAVGEGGRSDADLALADPMTDGGGPSSLIGMGPPSPLTGCYLLIILGEPHSDEHKDVILQSLLKGMNDIWQMRIFYYTKRSVIDFLN